MKIKRTKKIAAMLLAAIMVFGSTGVVSAVSQDWWPDGYCNTDGGWADTNIYGDGTVGVRAYVSGTLYVQNMRTDAISSYISTMDDDSNVSHAAATAWLYIDSNDSRKYRGWHIESDHHVWANGYDDYYYSEGDSIVTYAPYAY